MNLLLHLGFYGAIHILVGNCQELHCSGDSLLSVSTTYIPSANLDVRKEFVRTLQDFLDGHSSYVTVAVDDEVMDKKIKYGTPICISKLNEKYRRVINFEIRDTRQPMNGLGYSQIAIPVQNATDFRNKDVQGVITLHLPFGTLGDGSSEEDLPSEKDLKSAASMKEDYIHDYKRERYYHPYPHQGYHGYPYPPRTTTTTERPYHHYYPQDDYYYRNHYHYRPPLYYNPPYPGYYYNYHPTTTTTTTKAPYYDYPYYYPNSYPYGSYGSYRRQSAYLHKVENSTNISHLLHGIEKLVSNKTSTLS